jgi:hypothetical protein
MAGRDGLMQFLIPKADDRPAFEGRPLQIKFAARVELSAEFSEGFTRTGSARGILNGRYKQSFCRLPIEGSPWYFRTAALAWIEALVFEPSGSRAWGQELTFVAQARP